MPPPRRVLQIALTECKSVSTDMKSVPSYDTGDALVFEDDDLAN